MKNFANKQLWERHKIYLLIYTLTEKIQQTHVHVHIIPDKQYEFLLKEIEMILPACNWQVKMNFMLILGQARKDEGKLQHLILAIMGAVWKMSNAHTHLYAICMCVCMIVIAFQKVVRNKGVRLQLLPAVCNLCNRNLSALGN